MTKFLAVDVKNGLEAAESCGAALSSTILSLGIAHGPKPTLPGQRDAAVQLPHCCHSWTAQHSDRRDGGSADKPDLRFPPWGRNDGTIVTGRSTLHFLQRSEKSGPSCPTQQNSASKRRQRGLSWHSTRAVNAECCCQIYRLGIKNIA
jgi:hypothetical protein